MVLEEYNLFQEGILGNLRSDREFFKECVAANIRDEARRFWCDVQVSEHKLRETWEFWLGDLDRILEKDTTNKTKELDQFKQTAFLTFWLRRHQPLLSIKSFATGTSRFPEARGLQQRFFAKYGNEISALQIGVLICLNYSASSIAHAIAGDDQSDQRSGFVGRDAYIRKFERRKDFWVDFAMILKHKNNSPHSINLIYEALFGLSLDPVRKRSLQSGGT